MFLKRVLGFMHRWLLAFFGSLYAFTLGLGMRRHRHLMLQVAQHFGYRYKRPLARPLPRKGMDELFPAGLALPQSYKIDPASTRPGLVFPSLDDGGVGALDLAVLVGLVGQRQPKAIFEFGTFRGATTYNLALNAPADARVYTLDLPQEAMDSTALPLDPAERQYVDKARSASGLYFRGTAMEAKITPLFGDSATFDFSPYVNGMDLVFVDASHAYEYVLQDAKKALTLLKDGKGVLAFHDYLTWDGVTRALDELALDPVFAGLFQVEGTPVAMLIKG